MAYNVKSFTFWVSYYDTAQELTPREQGQFYRAVMDYIFTGEDRESALPKTVRIAYKSVKSNLKRSLSNKRASGENREEIGEESGENRGEVPQPENALNLKLKLKSKSNSNQNATDSASAEGEPPRCQCGRIATRHPVTRRWYCWKCEAEVSE